MKKVLLIIPILFIYILYPSTTWAQTATQQLLQVSPIIQDLTLQPGTTTTYPLTIINKGDKPVGFHIDVTGIDPTTDSIQNPANFTSPLISWISVNPADLIVAPHSTNAFTVTINTPKNAKTNGYYATLFLTPFISNPLRPNGPVILERIGTLLLTTVGKLDYSQLVKKVHVANFSFVSTHFLAPQTITFTVSNAYFTHFTAKPFLKFTSLLDKEVTIFPEEKHILPGSSRTWSIPVQNHWYTIYSSARLAISIGNGQQIFAQTTFINYPLLAVCVLGVCLILLLIKRARQLKKAFTILISGHE